METGRHVTRFTANTHENTAAHLFAGLALLASSVATADAPVKHTSFKPGEIWTDNNGVHINAHGGIPRQGHLLLVQGAQGGGTPETTAQVGVHCYSSRDLYNWKDEGIALKGGRGQLPPSPRAAS